MPSSAASTVKIVPFASRQYRRHNHRAGMNRAALERVVEILAMNRRAVDKRCGGGRKRAAVSDRRARPVIVAGGEHGLHVIFVARGDGEADDVNNQVFAFAPHGAGQPRCVKRADLLRQQFGNGGFGKIA